MCCVWNFNEVDRLSTYELHSVKIDRPNDSEPQFKRIDNIKIAGNLHNQTNDIWIQQDDAQERLTGAMNHTLGKYQQLMQLMRKTKTNNSSR